MTRRCIDSLLAIVLSVFACVSCKEPTDPAPASPAPSATTQAKAVTKDDLANATMKELAALTDDIVTEVKSASDKHAGVAAAQRALDATKADLGAKMAKLLELRGHELRDETQDEIAKTISDVSAKMAQLKIELLTVTMSDKALEAAVEKLTSDHESMLMGEAPASSPAKAEAPTVEWPFFKKDDSVNETMKELSTLTDDVIAKVKDASDKQAGVAEAQKLLDAKKDDLTAKLKEIGELRGFQLGEETQGKVAATIVDATTKMAQLEIDLLTATMSDKTLEAAVEKLTSDHEAVIQAITEGD